MVEQHIGEQLALHRVAQSKIDVVVAALHAEHGLGRPAEQRAVDGARGAGAAVDAIIVLMKLVAVVAVARIVEVPGEIVEQVQLVFDHIGVGLPRSAVVGLRHPRRQRKAAGVAAVGRVECAIKTDLSRGQGAQRHLIGGIPGVGVGHRGRGEAVRRGALAVTQQSAELAHIVGRGPRTVIGVEFAGIEQRAAAGLGRAQCEKSVVAEAADGASTRCSAGRCRAATTCKSPALAKSPTSAKYGPLRTSSPLTVSGMSQLRSV